MRVFVTGASGFIGQPYFYSLDRARRELGYAPTIDLREGVRRYFAEGGDSR